MYVIYKVSNGEIVKTVSCPPSMIEAQIKDGQAWIESLESHSWMTHKVVQGELVELSEARVPPTPEHQWDDENLIWVDPVTLSDRKSTALARIDEFAGAARLRYITSVPGQAETYAKKEEQARQWASSGFTGNAPSFIAAEATALNRDPISVAQEIIGLADIWSNYKGPEIEACRRKWKVSVENALSNEEVNVLLSQAENELSTL